MGIFGGRFKMGRHNPNIWVWVNGRLGIFGDHPVEKLATHDVLKPKHLTKTGPIFTFSLPCNSVLSNGAYLPSFYRATVFCALMQA